MSKLDVKCFDKSGNEIDVSNYQLDEEIADEIFLVLDGRMMEYDKEREGVIHQAN